MNSPRSKSTIRLPPSTQIKLALLLTSVGIVIGTLLYSHQLVSQLKVREQRVAKLFADALRYFQNAEEPDATLYQLITDYTRNSGVPVILTDKDDIPSYGMGSYRKFNPNISLDSTLDSASQLAFLRKEMERMDKQHQPEKITYKDPTTSSVTITNYIHYGDSIILSQIENLPIIQLLLGAVVAIIGYLSFSYLKRSEQQNIWVGMSKETAHQLGTPLSSILGWTEMLRLNAEMPKEVAQIADEIQKDTERLNRIATRFSKIGSIPDLKVQNIVESVSQVMGYLDDRMPKLGKTISFTLDTDHDEVEVKYNRELFEWVIENIVKNAIEAIEAQSGAITIHILDQSDKVLIDITDTGKGLDSRQRKDIFRPGYTTKARGWGLGLSLAKRIVEEYHHGKLFVKDSAPGKGTTFRIRLEKA